ncbi:MAG: hypothetical protein ACI8TP_004823, partial [Acidimicrobiales bacterium]
MIDRIVYTTLSEQHLPSVGASCLWLTTTK